MPTILSNVAKDFHLVTNYNVDKVLLSKINIGSVQWSLGSDFVPQNKQVITLISKVFDEIIKQTFLFGNKRTFWNNNHSSLG